MARKPVMKAKKDDAKDKARKAVADKGKVEIAAARRSMPKGKK